MIKTPNWRKAESEAPDVEMSAEDWMADEIDGLREELTEVYKQHTELLEAAKAALKEAEDWIKDQLEGTSSYQSAMKDLQPIRTSILIAEAAE